VGRMLFSLKPVQFHRGADAWHLRLI